MVLGPATQEPQAPCVAHAISTRAPICHHSACCARANHQRRRDDRSLYRPNGQPIHGLRCNHCVQGRGKLLIFRPFDAAPFQKGIGLGRDLLLRHLRGDAINWQALLAKYCEERVCSTCAERKQSTAFTPGQWKRSDTDRVCRECTKHYADAGTPWQCNVCKLWHVEANFPAKHRQRQCSFFRVCLTCELKKPCFKCGVPKPEKDYLLLYSGCPGCPSLGPWPAVVTSLSLKSPNAVGIGAGENPL